MAAKSPNRLSAATLGGWLRALAARHPRDIDLGLERVEKARAALKLSLPMPTAIVGGTNGKGSVCATLAAILREGGMRVGAYTSPHLLRFNERVRVDGEDADDKTLLAAFDEVEKARAACNVSLTYFEFTTLAAAWIFADSNVEAAILEVGLGGRLDAVNIFEPSAAAVSNVALDHQEFLGDDIASIAREKGGIFRRDIPAIVGDSHPPPELLESAEKTGAMLRVAGRDFVGRREGNVWHYLGRRRLYNLPTPAMRGEHQIANAATALAVLESMPDALWPGIGAVRQGLHAAAAEGRGQIFPGRPPVVVDVAHNPAAAMSLEKMLFAMGYFPQTSAVLGMAARKDAAGFARALSRRIDHWFVARPEGGDLSAASLAAEVEKAGGRATACESVAEAAAKARDFCGESGRMVITGSFMTVADYLRHRGGCPPSLE